MPPDTTPLNPGAERSTAAPAAERVHWMVRMNWRNRSIFCAVLVPVFAVHLREVQADTAPGC